MTDYRHYSNINDSTVENVENVQLIFSLSLTLFSILELKPKINHSLYHGQKSFQFILFIYNKLIILEGARYIA